MYTSRLFSNLFCPVLLSGILAGVSCQFVRAEESSAEIPHLIRQGSATQFVVDGKPFLMLGGELHNSSSSSLDYMKPKWSGLVRMNLNTVLTPVYWELVEPQQGTFDFSLVDGLIEAARQHNLRLVLLWFGSWKNSMSCYAPAWVKVDQQQFPRARVKDGQALEILSPFYQTSRDADARAFGALLRHIKEVDGQKHTVLMVQVENEIGMLTDARDYSDAANAAFAEPVPKELMDYLTEHKETLTAQLRDIWAAGGYKANGTWEEVFGKSLSTDEVFMAWQFGRYVDYVAAAGKAEYPLPMYVNAALIRPGYKPGQYPSAGPLPHLMDVWRAAAPHIDFLSPDIYFADFSHWCREYDRSGNAMFIPEVKNDGDAWAKAFYALGAHNAMGYSPFGIDSTAEADSAAIKQSYDVLSRLTPLILQKQGSDEIAGVLLDKENQTEQLKLGGYTLKASHDYTWGWSSGPKEAEVWPQAGGIIISTGPDEYVIAGSGVIVTFASSTQGESVGIVSVDQGSFENGQWVPKRRLNGDETHQGRHVRLPFGGFDIQKVKLYQYR
jgi:beta-galactosidase GanA